MAEFSVYPDAIDGYAQLPLVVDNVTRVDAITVNRLRCAIVNIENELGVLPSSINYPTVRARLDALEDAIGSIVAPEIILGYKNPVKAATITNVSLSSAPQVVDGITLIDGDRVLVHQQTSQSENGIYFVQSAGTGSDGIWIRSDDANLESNLIPGTEVYVEEGTEHGYCKFWLVTPGPYIIGITPLEFLGGLCIMRTDSAPTVILPSTAIGAGEPSATETQSISVRGFQEIDFSFLVSDLDSISELRARVLYSLLESPDPYGTTPSHWNILLAEDIVSGIATVDPYTLSLDTSSYPDFGSLPGSFAFRSPVSGLHMMVLIWSESGASAASDFTGIALRRV